MFWAMHLTQPNTVAIFDYKLYEWSRGRWRTTTSNEVDVSLNNGIEEFKVDDETNLRSDFGLLGQFLRDSGVSFRLASKYRQQIRSSYFLF